MFWSAREIDADNFLANLEFLRKCKVLYDSQAKRELKLLQNVWPGMNVKFDQFLIYL